ncbi:MAG: SGNH/GDSL hydrolase N-terminal domain-containing protein [Candidatus Cryptobacteroides sp.]
MKRILLSITALLLGAFSLCGQNLKFTEASDLTLIGKIIDTPNPYHRVDTVVYKGFTKQENIQVRCPSGLAVVFRTNSSTITVKTEYGYQYNGVNTMPLSYRGYDLYIRKGEDWLWAASGATKPSNASDNRVLIKKMDGSMKECLLYLPIYSELYSVQIGVDEGAVIEAIESPFRYRVGIFGSSYTHGISTSRAGMTYPAQFTRRTGIQMLSLGCSGNCKLQSYFADVLCDAEVDALVFDAFSNPRPEVMEERLFPFIEKVQSAHPDIPLIFLASIYREQRNFNTEADSLERAKAQTAERLMKEACKKYKNVYYIDSTNATSPDHESSVDGIHPGDYGYTLWERSIEKPLLKILRRYGIK